MFKTLKNAWKIPELQNKILFTLLIVLLYRVGSAIPVPYVNADVLTSFNSAYGDTILGYMSILSGGAMSQATLFALSVSPYITASIVIQLLTVAFPNWLGKIAKDGEEGQKKIKKYTRIVTVVLALITAYGYTALLASNSWLNGITWNGFWADTTTNGFQVSISVLVIIASYCAGAAIIMWLAELIDAKGIGNGISMILFFNILSRVPYLVSSLWSMITSDKFHIAVGILLGVLSVVITLAMIVLVIWVTNSERRIPIQYAKRVVGRKMYGGQGTNLPIKLNMTGVMPIIFASSIVSVPATIATFITNENNWFKKFVGGWFDTDTWPYIIVYLLLIVAFSYFYILISFNPIEVANNIKNNGGSVPGIRTGKPTAEYITKILNRITLIGAFFLCIVAGLPMIINVVSGGAFAGIAFGGSSLLIVIGVALETFRDIEAQITMRNYKGFLD